MLSPDSAPPTSMPALSARQEELLDALEALAMRERFGRVGVGDMAARLNCSRSTLYAIAPSKEQLFLLVMDRLMQHIESAALEGAARRSNPAARLSAYLERALEEIRKIEPPFIAEIHASAATRQRLAEFQRTIISQMREFIEAGIEAGEFEPVNSVLAAELLDAAASRIQDPRVLAESGLSGGEALTQVFQLVTRGLLK